MNTADKLREYLRGERDWEPKDMAREFLKVLESIEISYTIGYNRGYAAGRDESEFCECRDGDI